MRILGLPEREQGLTCGCSDHSVRTCPSPFTNMYGTLDPELGTIASGETLSRWKEDMRGHFKGGKG